MSYPENDSRTLPAGWQPPPRNPRREAARRRNWLLRRTLSTTLAGLRITRGITDDGYQTMLSRHRLGWGDITTAATIEHKRLRRARGDAVGLDRQAESVELYTQAVATGDPTEIFQAINLLDLAGIDVEELTK